MTYKRLSVLIVSILMILLVPIIIYLYNFNSIAFDKDFYKREFSKYNIYDNLKNYDIENINNDVLNYLKNDKNSNLIENNFFNEREKTHLLDVKNLIGTILAIYYFSISLFFLLCIPLIFLLNFKIEKIVKIFLLVLLFGSALTLLEAVLLFILSNFNFDFIFDLFHKTFFIFGTYTFNPVFEKIVILYPQNFFFDFLIRLIASVIISSIIILFFSITILFFLKNKFFGNFFKKSRREK